MNNSSLQKYFAIYFLTFSFMTLALSCSKDDNSININEPEPDIVVEIPQVSINTNGGTIVDEPKIDAQMTITKDGENLFEGNIGIEIRGASSQALFPKKSYGLETRDVNNEDIDVSILGLPEEEDWILHGPYSDKSLMRNILIYDLSRDIGMYASRSVFVELTINQVHKGIYVFMEKLKRDKNRIDINKLKDDENSGEDLTGGYILKIDKLSGNNLGEGYNNLNSFSSTHIPPNGTPDKEIHFLYEEPDAEDISPEQKTYISTYVADFENALASTDFADPELGYAAYIDVPSFIDFFLLNELSNNVDGYRLSTFMHKEKNGKLKMGPIWDFNLAFGNAGYCNGGDTNVWAYKFNERCPDDIWLVPFWWERLLQDPNVVALLKQRWTTLRGGAFSNDSIYDKVNTYSKILNDAKAIDDNFNTWKILGTWIWPNKFVGNNYGEEKGYLNGWIMDRLSWLDSNINSL